MTRWKRGRRSYSGSRDSYLWNERDWVDADAADDDLGDDGHPFDDGEPAWLLPPRPPRSIAPPVTLGWQHQLDRIAAALRPPIAAWPAGRTIDYVIALPDTRVTGTVALDVGCRQRKRNGEWRRLTTFRLSTPEIERLPDPTDRRILATLFGDGGGYGTAFPRSARPGWPFIRYQIPATLLDPVLPLVLGTGRAALQIALGQGHEPTPVTWDDGPPWAFGLDVRATGSGRHYEVTGALSRGDERIDLSTPLLLLAAGLVFFPDRVARLEVGGAFPWISHLRQVGALRVPVDQADQFLAQLLRTPVPPGTRLPPELAYETVEAVPRPRLRVQRGPARWPPELLHATLAFDYDGALIEAGRPERGVLQLKPRRLMVRAPEAERAALERLAALGVRERSSPTSEGPRALALSARVLPRLVRALLAEDWHVEADGAVYRRAAAFKVSVTSGADWFDLHGTLDFGDTVAHLPALLAALRRGETMARLDDGTYGLLPEEWLGRYARVAGLGTPEGEHLRFGRSQIGLLDALVTAQPEIDGDALFARARDELRRFDGVVPLDPPDGFVGRLRTYQRDGLGWFRFLRSFGFGGCLADDMGLGKTVMVLALLESRRAEGAKKPSLVVVPRSLVFNWKQEAARFTPGLAVLDHTGTARRPAGTHFAEHDVVLTTYGTLRRDALHFKDVEFDYVVLDEAQAIKNAATDAARAARLLRGDHRLALSGTPVENHLGELWSLFAFLNPGMLGAASALGLDGGAGRSPDEETRTLLARALRPFILRRTKAQVAPELPARTEQTVYCELEPAQRRLYDELRD
ncbi:MAG TPA: SNF2-related protein, partial [Methylomirabilota bacterium]|nr:SNF2-related protein [Methylomirabilota bacterium]